MDLYGTIMNIQAADPGFETDPARAYKLGHRDARHAAADLALKADACIEVLLEIVASAERNEAAINTFLLIDAREALAAMAKGPA